METGIENEQSIGDADVFTLKNALEMTKHNQTTIVFDDTKSLCY